MAFSRETRWSNPPAPVLPLPLDGTRLGRLLHAIEREREKAKPQCPTCKGAKVIPQLGGFMGQTVKKS